MRSLSALLVLSLAGGAEAQQLKLGGQVRPRFEYRNPGVAASDEIITMRLRADVTATLDRGVSAFLQLQDVRMWGEALTTVTDARAADFGISQGYAQLATSGATAITFRVGRQALSFGEERLVGSLDWVQRGRAFDGLRATVRRGPVAADGFAFRLGDRSAGVSTNAAFGGVHGKLTRANTELEAYLLHHQIEAPDTRLSTPGARWLARWGRLESRLEVAGQLGHRNAIPVSAFLLAGRVTASLASDNRLALTLWYDYLSGDDDAGAGDDQAFGTLFATNHKFYGIADVFTDFPGHTGARGLRDAAVKIALAPDPAIQLALDVHSLDLAQRGGLPATHLAEEVDLVATWKHGANLVMSGGLGWVRDGPAVRALGRLSGDLLFSYVMMDVKF